jgi:hypothetical protein
VTGCESSIYGWQARTDSTDRSPSFSPANFNQQPVALFTAVTSAAFRGNEVALTNYLGQILLKVSPSWKVVSAQETASRINGHGLAAEYTRMRVDYEISDILDRDVLRKIGSAIGVRYVFQPHLASFTQTMTDRWKFPPFDVRMMQTRSSIMRMELQLWDVETGELLWASVAETTMQSEGLSQDPVYLQDIARATLGSMIADFFNGKTSSTYSPMNKFLNKLILEAIPEEQVNKENSTEPVTK